MCHSKFYCSLPVEYYSLTFPIINHLIEYKDLYCLISNTLNISLNLNSNISSSRRNSDVLSTLNHSPGSSKLLLLLLIHYYYDISQCIGTSMLAINRGLAGWITSCGVFFSFWFFSGMFLAFLREVPGFYK